MRFEPITLQNGLSTSPNRCRIRLSNKPLKIEIEVGRPVSTSSRVESINLGGWEKKRKPEKLPSRKKMLIWGLKIRQD
jgi:hypothetical protein